MDTSFPDEIVRTGVADRFVKKSGSEIQPRAWQPKRRREDPRQMVGEEGFEPSTSASRTLRARPSCATPRGGPIVASPQFAGNCWSPGRPVLLAPGWRIPAQGSALRAGGRRRNPCARDEPSLIAAACETPLWTSYR